MKNNLFFLSFILITSNLLAVGNKYWDLSTALVGFLHNQEVGKDLAREEIKKNYINLLTHFKNDPATFNPAQCTYVKQYLRAFGYVECLISDNVGWSLIHHLGLTQEKMELLDSVKTVSPEEFERRNSAYLQKFTERLDAVEKAQCNVLHDNAIKEASERMLGVIETTDFVDFGVLAIGLTTPNALHENGLTGAILRHSMPKS